MAGLSGKDIIAPLIFHETCNSELFTAWIQQQLLPSLVKGKVIIMDNASIHKSQKVRDLIEGAGCKLI